MATPTTFGLLPGYASGRRISYPGCEWLLTEKVPSMPSGLAARLADEDRYGGNSKAIDESDRDLADWIITVAKEAIDEYHDDRNQLNTVKPTFVPLMRRRIVYSDTHRFAERLPSQALAGQIEDPFQGMLQE